MSIFPILIGNSCRNWHKLCASPTQTNHLMNIRSFVGGSSALLLAWLGATYFHEIPPDRYPKQGRATVTTQKAPSDAAIADLGTIQR